MVTAEMRKAVTATLLDITVAGRPSDTNDPGHGFRRVLDAKRAHLSPEAVDRYERECRFFRDTGYAAAIAELVEIGTVLADRGHALHLEGAAAGSMVMYVAGLTPIDPLRYGLWTERFIAGHTQGNTWPRARGTAADPDWFCGRISTGLEELLVLLRRRGYSLSTSEETIPGVPATINAETRGHAERQHVTHLLVTTSSVAVLSRCLGPEETHACETDIQTWHLLAAGDTAGIDPLDSEDIRAVLRLRKPRSLQALADVIAVTRPEHGSEGLDDDYGEPVYQEDLMRELHEALGIGLRDAYEIIRTLGDRRSIGLPRAKECFFGAEPPEPLSPRDWNRLWDKLVRESPVAVCKANSLATAYHCLNAAYLKAHHPAEFRAMLQLGQTRHMNALPERHAVTHATDSRSKAFPLL